MDVEQFIIKHILEYPSLYKDINFEYSRNKVLDQLFFTNGNALDWVNGELVYSVDEEVEVNYVLPDNYFSTPIMSTEEDESDWAKKWRLEDSKDYKPHEICSKEAQTIYPICDYAAIVNIPNDIKPDWLVAAQDACFLAVDYFKDPYKHCRDSYIKQWIENREYDKIKKHLEKQMHYVNVAMLKLAHIKTIMDMNYDQ